MSMDIPSSALASAIIASIAGFLLARLTSVNCLSALLSAGSLAKFLAAWAVLGLSLLLTFPLWLTVNYLGQPDNGIILAAYIGSWLMSGAYLAIGICMSALTKSQVIAFILSVVICFLFVLSGSGVVLDAFQGWLPAFMVDTIASFSFLAHFESMSKGVLALDNIIYFCISIGIWLFASLVIIEQKKAD